MTALLAGVPVPAPAPDDGLRDDLPGSLLDLADADADALADALHDGALQALVVARYAADLAVRGGDPALARDAVQEALVALRRAVREVRPRGHEGLADALSELAESRAARGAEPLLLDVDADAAAALPARAAGVAHRLVQRALAAAGGPLRVRVTRQDGTVVVALDVAVDDPAGEAQRARAVGGWLVCGPTTTDLRLPPLRRPTEEAP